MPRTPLFVLALAAAATLASAHGGVKAPPPPADAGPPSGPGVPSFTGPSGTPPRNGWPGAKGGSSASPGSSGGGAGQNATPGSKSSGKPATTLDLSTEASPDAWPAWWNDHAEEFLQLRRHLVPGRPASRSSELTGRGRIDHGSDRRASSAEVERHVVPLLLELLASDEEAEVQDSALIALGRCANEENADAVLAAVRPKLSSRFLTVQTSAVLALGIHGSPRFVPLLGNILSDGPAGRQAVGGPVPPLLRSLAAVSLGLANHPGSVPLLTELLATQPDSQLELKSCTISALGSMANEAAGDATMALVRMLRERRLDSPLRAQVPLALARIDHGTREETVPGLLLSFTDRDQDDRVRISLAQALGELADPRQAPALDALILAARKDKHVGTRHAALMALAMLGRRDAPLAAQHDEVHQRLADLFKELLRDPASYTDRAWVALAVGVYASARTAQAPALCFDLLEDYRGQKDPSVRAAGALALGLSGVVDAAGLLLADFRTPGDPLLRGYAALALGFLGDSTARAEMLAMCADKTTEPLVREQVALGLALLRDRDVVPTLLEVLARDQVHSVSVSVARVLGRIGDEEAIPDLSALARDASKSDSTRGMAVVALGLLGERGDMPWNASLRTFRNPEIPVAALQMVFDIL